MWLYCLDVGCFSQQSWSARFAKKMPQIWRAEELKYLDECHDHWAVLVYFTCEYGWLKYCIKLLIANGKRSTKLPVKQKKTLPVHVNSSSLIPSPYSLFVSANQYEHNEGLLILSSDWQQFSASPSYEHLASAVVLLFYSQVSCDDKQGEWKVNALTSNNLQRLLTNQRPASQNGAKHFCQMGGNCGFYLLFPEK